MKLIAAIDVKRGLGRDGTIPWKLQEDLKIFRQKTKNSVVVMGSKTWLSLPKRPLPNRINIILSSHAKDMTNTDTVFWVSNLRECLYVLDKFKKRTKWVIGGAAIYKAFLDLNIIEEFHITYLKQNYDCDVFLPKLKNIRPIKTTQHKSFVIKVYRSKNHHEKEFQKFITKIMEEGYKKVDRTGIGTRSLIGPQFRFPIDYKPFVDAYQIPISTIRRTSFRMIVAELLWMLRGQTDAKILEEQKVFIWSKNSSKEALNNLGLNLEEGDCGPIYGFQWRHWGEKYVNCHTKYDGIDQIKNLVNNLRAKNPHSRRHILTAWNVSDINKMSLPPCHMTYNFYVSGDAQPELSCVFFQRSSDIVLAGAWNVTFAAVLTILIAKCTGMRAKEVIWSPVDCHIYDNYNEFDLNKLVNREPKSYPLLFVNGKKDMPYDYNIEDMQLLNYEAHSGIKFTMNV